MYQSSDILLECGLRNFLSSREGLRVGVEGGKGFQMKEKSRREGREGREDRKVKQGDGGTIQYAPGAPT